MCSQSSKLAIFKTHEFPICQAAQTRWNSFCPARRYHTSLRQASGSSAENDNSYITAGRQRAREKLADKEFFLSLLSSAATKREAKSYLSRFPSTANKKLSASQNKATTSKPLTETEKPCVNLGTFYGVTRSVQDTPVFRQIDTPEFERGTSFDETLHVALVKLTTPQFLDDETIDGVALTLTQLMRLGMASCVVVDPGPTKEKSSEKSLAIEQADRLSAAIDACDGGKSWRLDSAFVAKERDTILPKVVSRKMLLKPLRNNNTLIITPLVYSESTCKTSLVPANNAILALTRELAGLERDHDPDEDPAVTAQKFEELQKEVSLDRLIVLDSRGGIPSFNGKQAAHVFINMEQEFDDIREELTSTMILHNALEIPGCGPSTDSPIANSNPISMLVSSEMGQLPTKQGREQLASAAMAHPVEGHLENLELLKQSLELLPPSASGIITTPTDVANSARPPLQDTLSVSQVGTRRQRNPLIHNLLTDKPLHSSSLPATRLKSLKTSGDKVIPPLVQSTFIKRGMPLTILPDPRVTPWTPDNNGESRITLNDPRIDLPRLIHLIEDSFNRKVDVQDYLNRINDRIAGLIIAGEYEGGAILTWETPPDIPDSERHRAENISRLVPYLDKFAVLKRSQGAGGVADIVFNAMVRSCLPQGVCWRSRKDNPVNKWYFERSRGTWKLHGSNWAMFWTTPGVPEEDPVKFKDYEAVCRNIQPSWADKKSVVD